jgi:hypothetical protein
MELKEHNSKEDLIVIELSHDEFYGIYNVLTAARQQYDDLDRVILERTHDEIRKLQDAVGDIVSKLA